MAKSDSASSSLSSASSLASKSASSASSLASKSASSASKLAAASASKASKAASVTLSSGSTAASKSLSSASAKASAAAADAMGKSTGTSATTMAFTSIAVVITLIVVALTGLYFSGYADNLIEYFAKIYYKRKAEAEATALEKVGEGKAEGFLKDQLKKNPVMGEDELEQVAPGLGKEASMQGLGGVSSKLGGLGKF